MEFKSSLSAASPFKSSLSAASPFKSSLSAASPFKNLSYDMVKLVLDMVEFKYADLKDLTKGFPVGSYHRTGMEYRTETQRLLEERRAYYLGRVQKYGRNLKFVPKALRDREMCLEAVKRDGAALMFVPEALYDLEMCLEAIKGDGMALEFIPYEYRNREMCLETVKREGIYVLEFVPEEYHDELVPVAVLLRDRQLW